MHRRIKPGEKRYRCAICLDFDRCESCQAKGDVPGFKGRVHKHPMLVLRYAEQRDAISWDPAGSGLLGHVGASESSDSDDVGGEEEEEEAPEQDETGGGWAWAGFGL